MRRLFELAVRLPAVALQHARVVDADDVRRLREAAARLNGIDGRLAGDEGPEPLQVRRDAPARFIRRYHGTAADRRTQGRIGRVRLARGAVHRVHQPAARDRQAEAIAQQRGDLPVRQPEAFIQEDGERDRLRPQLHGGGAQGVGGLQGMAPLDAPPAAGALPDVDAKRADEGPLDRQLFLILRGDPHRAHGALTVRALPRQRRLVPVIHRRGRAPMRARPIGGPGLSPRPTRRRDASPARKRRGLAIDGAPRGLKLLFQFVVFSTEPLPLGLRAPQVLAETLDLTDVLLDDLFRVTRRRLMATRRHAALMPDSRAKYKREMRVSSLLTR